MDEQPDKEKEPEVKDTTQPQPRFQREEIDEEKLKKFQQLAVAPETRSKPTSITPDKSPSEEILEKEEPPPPRKKPA